VFREPALPIPFVEVRVKDAMVGETELRHLADECLAVFDAGAVTRKSSVLVEDLSLRDAYRVQDLFVERRTAVEPEFALRIGREINGERLDDAYLRSAIEHVSTGIEVHNFHFRCGKPTSQELIASNGIHACLVIGQEKFPLGKTDLGMQGVGLWVDGRLEASGIGHEVMDGPLSSLRWLARQLRDRGKSILPGQWVIPGSPVRLVAVPAGATVSAATTNFGSVRAYFQAPAIPQFSETGNPA
jgi:2-keto-4-pentenoate hydratase